MYEYYVRQYISIHPNITAFQIYRMSSEGLPERLCHNVTNASVIFSTMMEALIHIKNIDYSKYHFVEATANTNFKYYLVYVGP